MNILVVNENMKEEMNTPYSFEWKQSGIKAWIFFWPNCFVLSIFGLMVSTDSHALFCLFVYWFNGCTALLVC